MHHSYLVGCGKLFARAPEWTRYRGMSNYPPLRLAALNQLASLQTQMEADPEFLENDDCPYDNETKELLAKLLKPRTVEVAVEKVVGGGGKAGRGRPSKEIKLSDEDQQKIIDEIKATLKGLKELADKENLETNESIQIAKTRTSLVDQLLKLQERYYSVTRNQQFIEDVIGILNDFGDEELREYVQNRLEQYR